MIKIIENEDLFPHVNEYDLILVGTNVYCNLSNGFQRDVALNYPFVREINFNTKYGDVDKLGSIVLCEDDSEIVKFCLSYICRGFPPRLKKGELIDYLSYESLEKCLKKINVLYKGMNIACPLLGCSRFDGNGNKEKVIELFKQTCTDINITIYDYEQKSRDEKLKEIRTKELEVKEKDYNAYREMVKKRKEEAEKRYKKNGFARY